MALEHPSQVRFQQPPGVGIAVVFLILLLSEGIVGCIEAGTAQAVEPVSGFHELFAIHDYIMCAFC